MTPRATTIAEQNQEIKNILDLPDFGPVEPGTYYMDPDLDPSTHLRVIYEVPLPRDGRSG
jgi:hypothetical protein